jgi:predicted phosphodiesterase
MRICVFSDIHGNGPAFWPAYEMMLEEKADLYFCLGDLCGYYFDQIEIFRALSRIPNLVCVKGNHGDIFLRIRKGNSELAQTNKEGYGSSMEYLARNETVDFVQWL